MWDRLVQIAKTPRLLIATDFDGTLGPIVPHPELASPSAGMPNLLRTAIGLPRTFVGVVSGRALADLRQRLGPLPGAWLVGGHGAEISGPNLHVTPDDVSRRVDALAGPLLRAAPPSAGFLHEHKPTGIAVHYRHVDRHIADRAVAAIAEIAAAAPEVSLVHGKQVLELLAVDADKGRALNKVRRAAAATAVLYLGDDTTDEDAFAVLGSGDLSVKIGQPPTAAEFCIATIEEGHALLRALVEHRRMWLESSDVASGP